MSFNIKRNKILYKYGKNRRKDSLPQIDQFQNYTNTKAKNTNKC